MKTVRMTIHPGATADPVRGRIDPVREDATREKGNWDKGKRRPADAARALLNVLEKAPEAALAAPG